MLEFKCFYLFCPLSNIYNVKLNLMSCIKLLQLVILGG